MSQSHLSPADRRQATPERAIEYGLTEYEASVLLGALAEYAENHADDASAATALMERAEDQLPREWRARH